MWDRSCLASDPRQETSEGPSGHRRRGILTVVASKESASRAGGKVTLQLSRCFLAGGLGWEIGSSKLPVTSLE